MTTPYIMARRKAQQEASQGVMPLPVDSGPKLAWQRNDQQQQEKLDKVYAAAGGMTPINDTLDTGLSSANARVQQINNIGEQENQRVAQQVQAKAQAEAEAARQAQMTAGQAAPVGGGYTGGQITQSQGIYQGDDARLADVARQAGWAEKDIPMAVAIMRAESGGNARALNTSNRNGSTDTGIFQINSIHSAWTKQYDLYDPVQNAKAALKIFKDAGSTWKPWSTYTNNAYTKFLKQPSSYAPAPGALQPFTGKAAAASGIRMAAVNTAMTAVGLPYVWGGNNINRNDNIRDGVDCSGLVQQVYKSLGVSLPRQADEQSRTTLGRRTTIDQLKPGDLVAWQGGWRGPQYVGHIAVYKGNNEIIEAYSAGNPVRTRALRPGEKAFGVALSLPGD